MQAMTLKIHYVRELDACPTLLTLDNFVTLIITGKATNGEAHH